MPRLVALVCMCLGVLVLGAERAPDPTIRDSSGHAEVVVTLASPALAYAPNERAAVDAEQRAFRAALATRLPAAAVHWRYRLVANGFSVSLPTEQIDVLRGLPGVRDVYESVPYEPQLDRSPAQIGAPTVWGSNLATSGQGMKIGIIDTGVDPNHPFFDPDGYTMPPGFPKGQRQYTTAKVIVARAFPPPGVPGRLPFDSSHGTHVAGIAAGNGATPATGGRLVSGIAPAAYLGNYKVFDGSLANSPAILAAIEAAVDDGMDVINFSGGQPEIEPSRDIIARGLDAAAAAGVISVIAAGNDYTDVGAGSVSSPGTSRRAITVAAVGTTGSTPTSRHAGFSSVGPTPISVRLKPDIAAPGVDILSAAPGGGWSSSSGTSMASPHIAGAAALLRQRHPAWTVAEIKSALVQTATDARRAVGANLAGPTFVGGGVVSLVAADEPLLFAAPSSVSLGLLTRGKRSEGAVELRAADGGAGTWQASVEQRASPTGATLDLPASVQVPGTLGYVVETTTRLPKASSPATSRFVGMPSFAECRSGDASRHQRSSGIARQHSCARASIRVRREDSAGSSHATATRKPRVEWASRLCSPARKSSTASASVEVSRTSASSSLDADAEAASSRGSSPTSTRTGSPATRGFRSRRTRTCPRSSHPAPVAGALSPAPGDYAAVFDSPTRAGAGSFTFRYWVNDVTPPTLRLRTSSVRRGGNVLVAATDAGSGVSPDDVSASIDGQFVRASFRNGVVRIGTSSLEPGTHRLRLRVSDYQETKNTENVRRILPNTRALTATFRVTRS